jgi:6-phosphogluconolactonase
MSPGIEIRRLATPQDLFQAAADEVIRTAKDAIEKRGRFAIALSGGSTPRNLFTLIAANASTSLPWDKTFFFWGDERHVPPTNEESNYRMADESLLSKVPIPPANIFRVPAEDSDAQTLRKFFAVPDGEFPRFDLILLGMGPDGHTASLFPETEALKEKSRWFVANWVEKLNTHRLTLTLPVLNAARRVVFLVGGTDKATALHEVLEGSAPAEKYPSKFVKPHKGTLLWLIDRAAASELSATA